MLAAKPYRAVRLEMRTGDPVAFSGTGAFARTTRRVTRSHVAHVGSVVVVKVLGDSKPSRRLILLVEATAHGVRTNRLSDRLADADENAWWLPIDRRLQLDQQALCDFLLKHARERTPYDLRQAIRSAYDRRDPEGPCYNPEDFAAVFCSELTAGGLEAGGVVGRVNASEMTPIDVCRLRIYEPTCIRLKGDKTISRYNTLDPSIFDV